MPMMVAGTIWSEVRRHRNLRPMRDGYHWGEGYFITSQATWTCGYLIVTVSLPTWLERSNSLYVELHVPVVNVSYIEALNTCTRSTFSKLQSSSLTGLVEYVLDLHSGGMNLSTKQTEMYESEALFASHPGFRVMLLLQRFLGRTRRCVPYKIRQSMVLSANIGRLRSGAFQTWRKKSLGEARTSLLLTSETPS